MVANLHADQINLSTRTGNTFQEASYSGFLTNTTVAAANTVQGLRDAVNAAVVNADKEGMRSRIVEAIDYAEANATLTDALVAPLTTVAGLIALTAAGTSTNVGLLPD